MTGGRSMSEMSSADHPTPTLCADPRGDEGALSAISVQTAPSSGPSGHVIPAGEKREIAAKPPAIALSFKYRRHLRIGLSRLREAGSGRRIGIRRASRVSAAIAWGGCGASGARSMVASRNCRRPISRIGPNAAARIGCGTRRGGISGRRSRWLRCGRAISCCFAGGRSCRPNMPEF